jgi:small nuclear ribonucleoprotein (snRNP)-like protein
MKSAIPRPLMPEGKEITKMETNNPNVVAPDGTPSEPKAQASTARPYKPMDFYHRFLKKNIQCKCTDGIVIKGILIAYNPYELCIGVADGAEIILSKHAVMFTTLVRSENEAVIDDKEA